MQSRSTQTGEESDDTGRSHLHGDYSEEKPHHTSNQIDRRLRQMLLNPGSMVKKEKRYQ